ncbi:MAG: hypothetical protein KatS3mg110_1662 [Pirellulaceae bacterium]|nr:MAG: hypothetical protein KatS3mg110_1662 [Pirellulaceae bacterium]
MQGRSMIFAWAVVCLGCASALGQIPIASVQHDGQVDFQRQVLPILRNKCLACHNASAREGDLVLETPESIRKGGSSGPAVVAGKSDESLLLELASHRKEPYMPPPDNKVGAKPLAPEELGLIKLWIDQGATGTVTVSLLPERWRPLPKRFAPIQAVSISPDSQFVACSRGNRILVYHLASGAEVAELSDPQLKEMAGREEPVPAHRDLVQALVFSPQGDRLASAGFRQVKIWSRPQDVRLWEVSLPAKLTAVAVQPEQRWIAAADEQGNLSVWQPGQDKPLWTAQAHAAPVTHLAFLPALSWLVSASEDASVAVWNAADGQLLWRIGTPQPVRHIAVLGPLPRQENNPFLAQEASWWLATSGQDNLIRLWSLSAPPARRVPSPVEALPSGLALDKERRRLAFVDPQRVLWLVDGTTWEVLARWSLAEMPNAIGLATPAPDAPRVFVGYGSGKWQLFVGGQQQEVAGGMTGGPAQCWAWTNDGTRFAAGGSEGRLVVYRVPAESPVQPEQIGFDHIHTVQVTPDGQIALVAGRQQQRWGVVLLDLASAKVVSVRWLEGELSSVAVSADRQRGAAATGKKVVVFDTRQPEMPDVAVREDLPSPIRSLALSPDGQWVLAAADDGTVRFWQVADPTKGWEWKDPAPIKSVLFLGNQPAVLQQRSIRLLGMNDGMPQRSIDIAAGVDAVSVSADGARMAVACEDAKLRVVEMGNGQERLAIDMPWPRAQYVQFSQDTTRLLAAAGGQGLALWNLMLNENRAVLVERHDDAHLVAAVIAPNGGLCDTWRSDGIWSRKVLYFERWMGGLNQAVSRIAFHPNGQQLYSACADGSVRGHRLSDGQVFFTAGHGSPVGAMAVSPDGQWLVTGGQNGQVRLWNAGNGAAHNQQPNGSFAGDVLYADFSPDGSRLSAVGADPAEVRIWEVASGVLLERRSWGGDGVAGLALIGGGTGQLAVATRSEGIFVAPHYAVKSLAGHGQEVTGLSAAPQSPLELYSASRDGTIRRWNVLNSQTLQQFNHGAPVLDVAVSSDGTRLASGGENNAARLWNAQNGQMIAELRGDLRRKNVVAERNRQVAQANARLNRAKQAAEAAEKDVPAKQEAAKKTAEALAAAQKQVEEKTAQLNSVTQMKLEREKAAIDAASAAQKALEAKRQAEAASAETKRQAEREQQRANRLAALAQSMPQNAELAKLADEARRQAEQAQQAAQQAAAAVPAAQQAYDAAARAANEAAAKVAEVQKPYNDAVVALEQAQKAHALAEQNHAIADRERQQAEALLPEARQELAEAEKQLQEAQQAQQQAQQEAAAAEQPITCVCFSPDGKTLATASRFIHVHLWDAQNGSAVAVLAGHQQPASQLAFLADAQLVSAGQDGRLAVWDTMPSWRLEQCVDVDQLGDLFQHRITALDFSPDGKWLAIAGGMPSRDGALGVWDLAASRWVLRLPAAHNDTIYAVAFSPDGKRLATAAADKYAQVFDVATGQLLRRLEGHTNYVLGVAWHSSGDRIATAGADRTVKIWNAESGDQLRTISNYGKHVTSVQFMGDSDNIVSACGDGVIRMHNSTNGGNFRNFGGAGYVQALAISRDQQWLVAGGMDGELRLWNANNGQLVRTWPAR